MIIQKFINSSIAILSSAFLLVLAAPASASTFNPMDPNATEPDYLRTVCADDCLLKARGQPVVTYDSVNTCTTKCIAKPSQHAADLSNRLPNLCTVDDHVNLQPYICHFVIHGRDPIQMILNVDLHPDTLCPMGTTPTPGGDCSKCPDGQELDDLHTVCLDPNAIKDGLRTVYDFLPDDTQKVIQNKMGGDLGGVVINYFTKKTPADLFADYVYEHVFRDTLNFRRMIKRLGAKGIKALIAKMLSSVGTPQQPQSLQPRQKSPPAPSSVRSRSLTTPVPQKPDDMAVAKCVEGKVNEGNAKLNATYHYNPPVPPGDCTSQKWKVEQCLSGFPGYAAACRKELASP